MSTSYGNSIVLSGLTVEEAQAGAAAALKQQGFGILTEIDMKATLKAKLGVDHPPYKILGACNPPLANRALAIDPYVGLLLPCNVVIREVEGGAEVSFIAPRAMFSIVDNPALADVVTDVETRLENAMAALR